MIVKITLPAIYIHQRRFPNSIFGAIRAPTWREAYFGALALHCFVGLPANLPPGPQNDPNAKESRTINLTHTWEQRAPTVERYD